MQSSRIYLEEAAQMLGKNQLFIWILFYMNRLSIYERRDGYVVDLDDVRKLKGKSFFTTMFKKKD